MSGNRESMDGPNRLDDMSLPELVELMHRILDEIQLRMMEEV